MLDNQVPVHERTENGKDKYLLKNLEEQRNGSVIIWFDLSHFFFERFQLIYETREPLKQQLKGSSTLFVIMQIDVTISQKIDTSFHLLSEIIPFSLLLVCKKLLSHPWIH